MLQNMSRNVPLRLIWKSSKNSKRHRNDSFYHVKVYQKRDWIFVLGPLKGVLIDWIWPKRYQMKAEGLFFKLIAYRIYFIKFLHTTSKRAATKLLWAKLPIITPALGLKYCFLLICWPSKVKGQNHNLLMPLKAFPRSSKRTWNYVAVH